MPALDRDRDEQGGQPDGDGAADVAEDQAGQGQPAASLTGAADLPPRDVPATRSQE